MADEEAKGQEPAKDDGKKKDEPFDQEKQQQQQQERPAAGPSGFDDLPAETKAEIKRLRSEAASNRKAAQEAKAKVEEFEERDKTDAEKMADKLRKAEEARKESEAKLLRFEVATDKRVPAKAVKFLSGTTREELEAQADELIELASPATPDFDGGVRDPASPTKTPEDQHNEDLLRMLGRAPQRQP